jgi:hypothetical protein
MIGIGLFIIVIGYSIVYWGINAVQGKQQDNFMSYILPFIDKSGNIKQSGFLTPGGNVPGALGPVTASDVAKKKQQPIRPNPIKGRGD